VNEWIPRWPCPKCKKAMDGPDDPPDENGNRHICTTNEDDFWREFKRRYPKLGVFVLKLDPPR
jgi:hypothetical protein